MLINSFGEINNNELKIFCYSLERKFIRKDVSNISIYSIRDFHNNFLSFFLALYVLFFLKYTSVVYSFFCVLLFIFSFFYYKITYGCLIVEEKGITRIRIDKKDLVDAQLLVDFFNNLSF